MKDLKGHEDLGPNFLWKFLCFMVVYEKKNRKNGPTPSGCVAVFHLECEIKPEVFKTWTMSRYNGRI